MSILQADGLKKILGSREVLRGADLRIEKGEKVGIVGRNGGGKTTLLRLIEGEETPDAGTVGIAKGARIGYVVQRPTFEPGVTVRAYAETGLAEVHEVERELERVSHDMSEADGDALERLMKRHGHLSERMEHLGGWDAGARVEAVLSGIGLPEAMFEREACTLSGGEASRCALARELVAAPDLLLLDEPTNHLDLAGIEWLEAWLREMDGAVLLVSHDRRLLTRVVDVIVEVEHGRTARYPGSYEQYIALKAERYRDDLRRYEQQQDQIRKEDVFIKKHMGSQRTGEAKGRRKRLQSLERLERPHLDVRMPKIAPPKVERGGEEVLHTEALAVGHGDTAVLTNVEVRVGRGERVGIVGPNGAGKTTLLTALAGETRPLAGSVVLGHRAVCAYYDQRTSDLRDDSTVYGEIKRDHREFTDLEIRSHLAKYLFRGSDVDQEVRGLSGGERSRLVLAKLELTNPTWMALDEPTNHLDLASRTALEEMLGAFDGALVCVSHDRAFLDGLCNRIVEVTDGGARSFKGNYTDYRSELAAEADAARSAKDEAEKSKRRAAAAQAAKAAPSAKSKSKQKNPWKLERLEQAIITLEEEREQLLAKLATEEVYRDADATREAQFRLSELERELEEKNLEWERRI